MDYLEYWGEQCDPKPIGSVDLNTEHIAQTSLAVICCKVFAAVLITAGLFWLPYHYLPLEGWQRVAVSSGIVLLYIGISFFFIPRPETDNLGWAGGLINDPFHYSDNWNRNLLFLHGLLGPGRFVAGTFLDVAVSLGIAKSDPVPCSYEYYQQQYEALGHNATMTEFPPHDPLPAEGAESLEEEYQQRYGLSSARFLINDDE